MSYVAILTAANPKEDLVHLIAEFRALNASFNNPAGARVVFPVVNLNGTEDAIFNAYMANADIRIFHFSGHAKEDALLMDDGNLSGGNILASMMRNAKNLKLVFLNGCATYELADTFLKYGAGLVIATQAPIFDGVASQFSALFYECLCVRNWNIRDSFNDAKRRMKDAIAARKQEIAGIHEFETYHQALDEFEQNGTSRTIGKSRKDKQEVFQWGIYHLDGQTFAQREERENWKMVSEEPVLPPKRNIPSLALLRSIAFNVKELKRTIPGANDPHFQSFSKVEELYQTANEWSKGSTTRLIQEISNLLLLPLAAPFNALINHSRDHWLSPNYPNPYKTLLKYQLDLYKTFIKTATIIMLSDLMESILGVGLGDNENLKSVIRISLNKEHKPLSDLFSQIITNEKDLDDIEFDINIMRDIVSFLKDAREIAGEQDKENKFDQFIKEYRGNLYGSDAEKAMLNSLHWELIRVLQKMEDGTVDQMREETLRSYCDRVETALIELFRYHRYILMYEIVTVGKVEVNRRRDRVERTIDHKVFALEGLLEPFVSLFTGDAFGGFTENYSVLLVNHKTKILEYLSLSPFVINVGPFFDEDKVDLFYFNGKAGDKINYNNFSNSSFPPVQVDVECSDNEINNEDDTTFLTIDPQVMEISTKSPGQYVSARRRFQIIRDQYKILEKQFLSFIQ